MRIGFLNNMFAVLAILASTVTWAQVSFALDTAFRTRIQSKYIHSTLLRPDGNLIISGSFKFPGDFSFRAGALLAPDGSWNTTFAPVAFMGGKITPWEGKMYVANGPGLRRLFLDGSLDNGFNLINAAYIYFLQGGDYHVFPDGRVLLTGQYLLSDTVRGYEGTYTLVWITNTGYLDTTRVHRRANGPMWEFSALPDGKFICSCSCSQYDGQPVDKLFRIEADGSLDTSFHTGFSYALLGDLLPLPDGRAYAGGLMMNNDPDTLRLMRLLPDGSRDPGFTSPHFGGEGVWWPYYGTQVFEIFPFRPDQYIVAGQFTTVNGAPRGGICMIDTSGNLLQAFAGTALGPFTYQGTTNAGITNVYWANADSTALYICGTYAGYNDGTVNDTLQRFVSRLLVQDIPTGIAGALPPHNASHFSVQPNPATIGTVLHVAIDLPQHFTAHGPLRLTVTDALGRLVLKEQFASGSRNTNLPITGALAVSGVYHLHLSDASRWISGATFVVE